MNSYYGSQIMKRLGARFERLYGAAAAPRCLSRLAMMVGRYGVMPSASPPPPWSERTAWLITYPDAFRTEGEPPLVTLDQFLATHWSDLITTVHLLPFFPYSSDDGFSVVHFRTVRPDLGSWEDIRRIAGRFELAFDLVLNHVSRQSGWFADYQLDIAPARHYFIEVDPQADWSRVVRPRTTPLWQVIQKPSGEVRIWTTFSEDQIDLNYANPDVLFEMLDILLFYISMGARVIRLDAVAYLWKEPGTPCVHLPQTHEIVRLLRDFLELTAPHVLLLTETNVPHRDNVSYFGRGDEAHLVYNFSLPPLLLHTLLRGNARALTDWAKTLEDPPPGCAFLNFTASHDGIGLLPLEGLLSPSEVDWLVAETVRRGGRVSQRRTSNGQESPYELNITWFSALSDPDPERHIARVVNSQAIMMALKGIPAFYYNTWLAASNDEEAVERTGQARAINRHKWPAQEANARLAQPDHAAARITAALTSLLRRRQSDPAFHPDAAQRVYELGKSVFALERIAPDNSSRVLAVHNVTEQTVETPLPSDWGQTLKLEPYGFRWLHQKKA